MKDKRKQVDRKVDKLKVNLDAEIDAATANIKKMAKMIGNGTGELLYDAIMGTRK